MWWGETNLVLLSLLIVADRNVCQSVVEMWDIYKSNPNYYSLVHMWHHSNMD